MWCIYAWEVSKSLRFGVFFVILVCTCGQERVKVEGKTVRTFDLYSLVGFYVQEYSGISQLLPERVVSCEL